METIKGLEKLKKKLEKEAGAKYKIKYFEQNINSFKYEIYKKKKFVAGCFGLKDLKKIIEAIARLENK